MTPAGNVVSGLMESFPRTSAVILQGIADHTHLGVQLYVSVRGVPRADAAVGELRPGAPLTADTLMPWLSSGKPVAAVVIGRLWEGAALELDDPVVRFIPEFGAGGKAAVTIRHLLTHTGGFRAGMRYEPAMSWSEIIASICEARLEPGWIPGARAGYHTWTSWYILAEIVRRLEGREYSQVVRRAVFEPLGMMDSWIGIPPERRAAYGDRFGILYDTSGEIRPSEADGEARGWPYRPGGSGRGPMRELGRFYEMLRARGTWAEVGILAPQTVEALTARHRCGMFDQTFRHVMDWGLGFILDSKMYGTEPPPYGYGRHASSRTFGHSGYQSSCAFCDPEHGVVAAWAANGLPGEPRHQARAAALNAAIYEDLGLAALKEDPDRSL